MADIVRFPVVSDFDRELDACEAIWDDPDFWNRVPRGAIYAPEPRHPYRHKIISGLIGVAAIGGIVGVLWGALVATGVD